MLSFLTSCAREANQSKSSDGLENKQISVSSAERMPSADLAQIQLTGQQRAKLALQTAGVNYRKLTILLELKGQIEPEAGKEVDVSPRILGRVVKVLIHPGESVKPGQIMAILDSHEISELEAELIEDKGKLAIAKAQQDRESQVYKEQFLRPQVLIEARAKFAEAKSQLELADAEFRRQENLYEEKIASQKDFTRAKITREEARTDLEVAKLNLQREEHLYSNQGLMRKDLQLAEAEYERAKRHMDTLNQRLIFFGMSAQNIKAVLDTNHISGTVQVLAPVAGTVAHAEAAIGEMVHSTDTMFKIVDLSEVIVKADLPEANITLVSIGTPVQVVVPSYPQRIFQGTINFISETINKENHTVPIQARLENKEHLLKANMSAQINLAAEEKTILACPKEAVFSYKDTQCVLVSDSSGVILRRVTTGVVGKEYIEILNGLEAGDQVVVKGMKELLLSDPKLR